MQKEFIYLYKNKEYRVVVTKKRSHSISMRLSNGVVKVNASYFATQKDIVKLINKYAKKLFEENPHYLGFGEGYFYLLGNYVVYSEPGEIKFSDDSVIAYKNREDLDKKLKKWFLDLMTKRNRYYEKVMGVYESKVRVRSMISRYGSNSYSNHSITYSTVLMHYSIDVIDAIIVHELAHCKIHNHSKDFYKIVMQYCPNYKQLHKRLAKGEFHA